MPDTKLNSESKMLLGSILTKIYEVKTDKPFEGLIEVLNDIDLRDAVLDEAKDRIDTLLNSSSNTQLQ